MKLNNKGFAISSIMYIILILAIILISVTLALLSSRKLVLDKIKQEVSDDIYSMCKLVEGKAKTIGAKYECDFGGGVKNFYVLELGSNPVQGSTLESDEVALILEGNYDTATQAWCAVGSNNSCAADGLTSKLNDIATAWKELEREQIVLPSAIQVATADGQVYTDYPQISSTNAWLYNWPDNADYALGENVPYGYWTSTPDAEDSNHARIVHFDGYVISSEVEYADYCGVRPVVNVKL